MQAREKREWVQNRRVEQDARRKELHSKLASQGDGNGEENGQIIVNDFATEGYYYLNEHLAQRIKKHQIAGLRFLWGSTVTGSKELEGCLLAHTMGLGKTMQAIALLVSIAESSASEDPLLVEQIPERLRKSKTLVLCPPGLMDNWMDELLSWVRPDDLLGEFWKVDTSIPLLGDRLKCISDWNASGGVLILGYEMFRTFVMNIATDKRERPLSDEQHNRVMEELVKGPNIVIADEAHKMKNAKSAITKAAVQFETKCRIALTGSPLANNIQEYHTMIEWISPNYLGPAKEFRAKFVEPIQAGLWQNSTSQEKSKSRTMLRVLERDIDPKVQRADMSVLKHDMPPKTEFTITVALTEMQKEAYSRYVTWSSEKALTNLTKAGQIKNSTLWKYLGILTLLCNHPSLFKTKLCEPPKKGKAAKAKKEKIDETDDTPEIDTSEFDLSNQAAFQELVDKEFELFNEIEDIELMDLSNKVKVVFQILDAAREAKDKTLIFSQSIPTLDFLEKVFRNQDRRYVRLDGHTKMADRQKMTKWFNDEKNPTNIFIISTMAGGLGLNLPGANRVVIFDFKFNPIQEEQAIGRAYRIGQQKETFVYRLIAGGTFESIVYNTTVFKQQLASRIVDKKQQKAAAMKKVSDYLFQPKEVTQEDLSDFVGMDTHVLDKILESQTKESTICTIVQSDNFEREDEALTPEEEALAEQYHQAAKNGKLPPDAMNDSKLFRIHHGTQAGVSMAYDKIVNLPQPRMEFIKTGAVEKAPRQAMYMPPPLPVVVPQPSNAIVKDVSTPAAVANKSDSSTPTQSPAPSNHPAADSATRSEAGAAKPSEPVGTPSNAISNKDRSNSVASNAPPQSPMLPPTPTVDASRGRNSITNSTKSKRRHPSRRPESRNSMSTPMTPSGVPAVFGGSSNGRLGTPLNSDAKRRTSKQAQATDDEEEEEEDSLKVGISSQLPSANDQSGLSMSSPNPFFSDHVLQETSTPTETPDDPMSGVSSGVSESKTAFFLRHAKSYLGSSSTR